MACQELPFDLPYGVWNVSNWSPLSDHFWSMVVTGWGVCSYFTGNYRHFGGSASIPYTRKDGAGRLSDRNIGGDCLRCVSPLVRLAGLVGRLYSQDWRLVARAPSTGRAARL